MRQAMSTMRLAAPGLVLLGLRAAQVRDHVPAGQLLPLRAQERTRAWNLLHRTLSEPGDGAGAEAGEGGGAGAAHKTPVVVKRELARMLMWERKAEIEGVPGEVLLRLVCEACGGD
jgi:hypothetical protein